MPDFDWSLTQGDRAVIPALVYIRLKEAIIRTRDRLQSQVRDGDVGYIAWLTRNLVELRVWAEYCSASEANAQEFHEDAVRDLVELNMKVPGLDAATRVELDNATSALANVKPAHRFKGVADAADDVQLAEFYKQNNKCLSKFAHPTAVAVMAPIPAEDGVDHCREIGDVGSNIASAALSRLEEGCAGQSFRKYQRYIERMVREHPELGYTL